MRTPATRLYRSLEGLFAVYKPAGVHWKLVRDTVETNLLKGINSAPPPALRTQVKFLLQSGAGSEDHKEVTLRPVRLPVLADHPLVTGPEFQKLRVGVGHRLDVFSSGVFVLGVGNGNAKFKEMYERYNTRDYTLEGEFGRATDDFSHDGRVIERTTYDHITCDKLERVLATIQGANQKALLSYSNVDMRSQEAYELAVRGMLFPEGKTPPILTGLRCLDFQPPRFTLEVQCMNETQRYLRRLLHEVGLELRSSAVCVVIRRLRDGPFTLQEALTRQRWTLPDVAQAICQDHSIRRKRGKAFSQGAE
ncbi:mitochondrial mRNA pseudouridine synthase TRUB2 [Brienomyrus brachyistius]|uniref:mitochondrial mRNA pseudouridine synthase TRUB2 n=1 Tax=Brienomyrus brachyistius TaxID=42636 RepID=UPI0020B38E95|nr:mitochondrial mRNA pseudouridine synthase TRUB2 [Brienomyrus brachyistius]